MKKPGAIPTLIIALALLAGCAGATQPPAPHDHHKVLHDARHRHHTSPFHQHPMPDEEADEKKQ